MIRFHLNTLLACVCAVVTARLVAPQPSFVSAEEILWTDPQSAQFLKDFCLDCHDGDEAEAGLDLNPLIESLRERRDADFLQQADAWKHISDRVRDREMPPQNAQQPSLSESQSFAAWVTQSLRHAACSDGITPGPPRLRRLNRDEYAATVRDLLGIQVNVAQALPADGAGGEGFDNAAETLFVSPMHVEKYLDAAQVALDYAWKDPRTRRIVLVAEPNDQRSAAAAARENLAKFLHRAFRRPVEETELAEYESLFTNRFAETDDFAGSLQFAMQAAMISPKFLFLMEAPTEPGQSERLSDFELAARLSYFLWASMPDDELLRLAGEGKLNDDEILKQQVIRMLGGTEQDHARRNSEARKVRDAVTNFVEQWLGTRALGREFRPDPSIAGRYDSELEGGMKYEPIFFVHELLCDNGSLLQLIDADFTYANRSLARHYRISGDFREQPRRTELPADTRRGGLLGMSSVLAVSSYPHRTSPVLRGKWILEKLLGTPPPPPPPNVPELEETPHQDEAPSTLRARLEQHRSDPTCASCHNRMDPLGFGLENFDVLGNWRDADGGVPIDSQGELPDGTKFEGPDGLRQVLQDRKDQVLRHFTSLMMGFALSRGLTMEDQCEIDRIVERLRAEDYHAHALIFGIIQSQSFRYKQTPQTSGDET